MYSNPNIYVIVLFKFSDPSDIEILLEIIFIIMNKYGI